jgi:hypothetical protein
VRLCQEPFQAIKRCIRSRGQRGAPAAEIRTNLTLAFVHMARVVGATPDSAESK